jgi:hypothetical protein
MTNIQELIMERMQKGESPQKIAADLAKQVKSGKISMSELPSFKTYDKKTIQQGLVCLDNTLNELEQLLIVFNRTTEAEQLKSLTLEQKTELLNKFDVIVDSALDAIKSSSLC